MKRTKPSARKKQPEKANKLTKAQRVLVKVLIAKHKIRKAQLVDIAAIIKEEIGVKLALSTISEYFTQIDAEWRATYLGDNSIYKAAELAKLDHLEAEVYAQWERSKLNAESVTSKAVTIEPGTKEKGNPLNRNSQEDPRYSEEFKIETERTTKTEGQTGDPRYIHNLMEISDRRAKLLGIDAPTKIAPTNPAGDKEYAELTDDQRIAGVEAILNAARIRRDRSINSD